MKVRPPRAKPRVGVNRASHDAGIKALRRADELADIFKMLGNANRVKIVVFLDAKERSVSDIETALAIRQPTLSQQLGELRDAGLIIGRREAKSVIYALTDDLGRRALNTIYLASGRQAPRMETAVIGDVRFNQAAVFASVLKARGSQAPEFRPGFKSLLPE